MRQYATLTAPSDEPVTPTEFKELAREASSDYDTTVIPLHLAEARESILELTGRAAVNQTFSLTLCGFPSGFPSIEIERVPLVSVQGITYTDENGDPQTLSTDVYRVLAGTPGYVILKPDQIWPSIQERSEVVISFTAGYGADATNVPAKYKQACAMLAEESLRKWPMRPETQRKLDGLRWRVCYV